MMWEIYWEDYGSLELSFQIPFQVCSKSPMRCLMLYNQRNQLWLWRAPSSHMGCLTLIMYSKYHSSGTDQVRYGDIRRCSASPRPPCDGTPAASVWPSPRQTPGPPILQIELHLTQPRSVWSPPRHEPAPCHR